MTFRWLRNNDSSVCQPVRRFLSSRRSDAGFPSSQHFGRVLHRWIEVMVHDSSERAVTHHADNHHGIGTARRELARSGVPPCVEVGPRLFFVRRVALAGGKHTRLMKSERSFPKRLRMQPPRWWRRRPLRAGPPAHRWTHAKGHVLPHKKRGGSRGRPGRSSGPSAPTHCSAWSLRRTKQDTPTSRL